MNRTPRTSKGRPVTENQIDRLAREAAMQRVREA